MAEQRPVLPAAPVAAAPPPPAPPAPPVVQAAQVAPIAGQAAQADVQVPNLEEQVRSLTTQLTEVKNSVDTSSVEQALITVRQVASRPSAIFDSFALTGALLHLEEVARRVGHPEAKKFSAVLSQCKRLPNGPIMGEVVTRLLGDEVEKEVANVVAKMLKARPSYGSRLDHTSPGTYNQRGFSPRRAYRGFQSRDASSGRCFKCNKPGHYARRCPQFK
ncbi:hypothetical protein OS493_031153 [Desmophyllum pertusum]|uniref:CCHC-type domain-containing protein n=1 Tax=Desmophyllum pertusum TaxID=174260 RepID=A0A9X0D7L0_9CNID|nr:hypothetical protein OS493_031153 [Desmophyllum pertusum]